MTRLLLIVPLLLAACASTHRPPAQDYRFNGIDAQGRIQVYPTLHAYDIPPVRLDDYIGDGVSPRRAQIRTERTHELRRIPNAVADALPGAISTRLHPTWEGEFRVTNAGNRTHGRLLDALRRDDPHLLEAALLSAAHDAGGDATLFTWVRHLDGAPVSTLDAPGTYVDGPGGSLLVDLTDDPYLVHAEIGMALVTVDGHVVIRYADSARAVLEPRGGASRAGRQLAASLADEVCKVWPDDPYLYQHGPNAVAAHHSADSSFLFDDTAHSVILPTVQGP